MSTDNNSLGALARNGSNDARLSPRMRKSLDVHIGSSAGADDGLDLTQEPLSRLLAVRSRVVSVLKGGKRGEEVTKSSLAQLGEKSVDGSLLRDSGGEIGENLEADGGLFVEITDVDEVLVFL